MGTVSSEVGHLARSTTINHYFWTTSFFSDRDIYKLSPPLRFVKRHDEIFQRETPTCRSRVVNGAINCVTRAQLTVFHNANKPDMMHG